MKVLLVRPKLPLPDLQLYPPVSLVTLASYFDSSHSVQILDLQANQTLEDAHFKPDVVGISAFTSQVGEADMIAEKSKQLYPEAKIVVGGAGITSNPQYASNLLPAVDLVVVGDGEDFAGNLENYTDRKSKFAVSPYFDMTEHRIPVWNLIDYKRYVKTVGLAVETSRGCPFNCVWCTAHLVSGKHWRSRTPESIVQEIQFLKKQYNCNLFYFTDDNATVDPDRWLRLMQLLVDANLNVELRVPEGIQAHHLTLETLALMKKAGFKMITIGAESGSQRVLDKVIDKGGLKVEQIRHVVESSRKVGLGINCFFVIGTVGETLEEAKMTIDFAEHLRKIGAYSCMVRNAIPVPGTRMFQIAKDKGYLTVPETKMNDLTFLHSNQHFLKTSEWNPEQIENLVALAKRQDAQHILRHKKFHLLKQGVKRMLVNPKAGMKRLVQIMEEAK